MRFPNRSDTNRAVKAQKMAKRLENLDLESRRIFPCSENKGANCEADLRLCFRISKMFVFSWRGSIIAFCFQGVCYTRLKLLSPWYNPDTWCFHVIVAFVCFVNRSRCVCIRCSVLYLLSIQRLRSIFYRSLHTVCYIDS